MTRTIDRREVIKRGAVVGGLAWSAPLIQSIAAGANAQSAPGGTSPFCTPEGNKNEPKPCTLTLRYLGGGCGSSTEPPFSCCDAEAGPGCPDEGVDIYASWGSTAHFAEACYQNVKCGQTITPGSGDQTMNPNLNLVVWSENPDCAGSALTCPDAGSTTKLHVVRIHTSCSEPIVYGGIYGAFQIVSGTTC